MGLKKVFEQFPPPDFLNIPYVGISISDDFVRCIKFSKKGSNLSIKKYGEYPLPSGAVVGGLINNNAEITNILEKLKKDFDFNYARVSLPEEKAYLFTTKIPFIDNKDIRGTIEFKMEENVPIPPTELVFDYVIADPKEHADHLNVVVSALPIAVLDKYVDVMQKSNISLLSLEIESQAIARALLSPSDLGTYLLVHFCKEKVGLYVASHKVVHFTSTISTKGPPINDLSSISQEIKKLYMYWHTLKENVGAENKKISRVIVCGEGVNDEVVPHFLSHIKTETVLGNVWTNVLDINKIIPQISFEDSLRYAPAVGLALPNQILI